MQDAPASDIVMLRDRLILEISKVVTDIIAAAVAVVTWASVCSLVVISVWRSDFGYLLSLGRSTYCIAIAIYTVVTMIAATTTIAGFAALYAMVVVFRRNIEKNINLFAAIPYAIVLTFLPHGLLAFALLAVGTLTIPAAIALGFITR